MFPVFTAVLGGMAAFLFAVNLGAFFALLRGCFHIRGQSRFRRTEDCAVLLKAPAVPAISLLATVSDASTASREFVRRLLEVHYGQHELVLVLDGVSDQDLDTWKQDYRLGVSARTAEESLSSSRIRCIYESADPIRIVVVSKDRGGEADSLNAAVKVARSPLLGIIERGCDFQPDVFLRLVRHLLEDPEHVVAVCATTPPPVSGTLAGQIGSLESLRSWLGRCGSLAHRNRFNPPPGCSILVSRDAVLSAGGFHRGPLELFLRLHGMARAGGHRQRIVFVAEPVSHPHPAESFSDLYLTALETQRDIAGALRWRFRAAGMPALFTIRVLRPVVETLAYALGALGLLWGWTDWSMISLVLLSTVGLGILQSMAAVVFGEWALPSGSEPRLLIRLFWSTIPENVGYRQLRNLWLIAGFSKARFAAGHSAH